MSLKVILETSDNRNRTCADGEFKQIIEEWGRKLFEIENDVTVKIGVEKYFGEKPSDVFLKSPTRWGDLYKTYHWDQVTTTISPKVGTEYSPTNRKEMIVATKEFYNNSKLRGTFSGSLTHGVTKTVESSWNWNGNVGAEFPIVVKNISFGINFTVNYGISGSESYSTNAEGLTRVSVELRPGQKVRVAIMSTQTQGTTRIHFDTKLDGLVACNYSGKYQECNFWGIPISHVMSALGLSTGRRASLDINTTYHSNVRAVLTDLDSLKTISHDILIRNGSPPGTVTHILFRASHL